MKGARSKRFKGLGSAFVCVATTAPEVLHLTCSRIGVTLVAPSGAVQKRPQTSMSTLRLLNRSPRRYAASVLLPIACASAISTTSDEKVVDRNPWTVASGAIFRRTIAIDIFLSALLRQSTWLFAFTARPNRLPINRLGG
jgi:hypothetical protein